MRQYKLGFPGVTYILIAFPRAPVTCFSLHPFAPCDTEQIGFTPSDMFFGWSGGGI